MYRKKERKVYKRKVYKRKKERIERKVYKRKKERKKFSKLIQSTP